ENLWAQKFFSDIKVYITKIEEGHVYLLIHVEERPRLSKYQIKGLRKAQTKNVKDEVKISAGDIVNDYMKNKAESNIRAYFIDKGFSNVKVTTTEVNDTSRPNSSI